MRRVIFLIFAFFIAIAVAVLVRFKVTSYREEIEAIKRSMVDVVSATRDIPAFTTLVSSDLRVISIPKASIPEGEDIYEISQLVNKATIVPVSKGDMILSGKISMDPSKLGLAFQLKEGNLAMAIPVDEVVTAGGMVKPGDYVDILHAGRPKSDSPIQSRVLLSRVRVLAIGRSMVRPSGESAGGTIAPRTAVIEVSPHEATVLAWAQSQGNLWMALRAARDEVVSTVNPYDGPSSPVVAVEPTKAEIPKPVISVRKAVRGWSIEVIKPGNVSRITVSGKGD